MEKVRNQLWELIDEKVPDFDEISDLINRDFGNNLASALLRIYYAVNVNAHGDYNGLLTLEHVCPESHSRAWSSHDAVINGIKYKIGNMLLVSPEFNPHLSNKSFEEKKREYMRVRVKDIPDDDVNYMGISSQDEWNTVLISERSERLFR